MTVSPEEVANMKRAMQALSGEASPSYTHAVTNNTTATYGRDDTTIEIDSMKRILEAFNNVGETTSHSLAENSMVNHDVEEAIYTRRDASGVNIKNYKIAIEENKKAKRYSILENGVVIADNFLLYESAYSIVKLLNDGEVILSPQVRKIVHLEECYANARNEAAQLKQRYKLVENTNKADVIAAKFQQARDNALGFKGTINAIMESL